MPKDSLLPDDVEERLCTSPVKDQSNRTYNSNANNTTKHGPQTLKPTTSTKEADQTKLRQELANVRRVNEAIEGVLESLEKAKRNTTTVNQTVGSASSLLNIWTRILSQTEHNRRLILDPSWRGASQDIADVEEEATAKQHASERKDVEEQERRAAAVRKADEEERQRAEATVVKSTSTTRGRGRSALGSRTTHSAAGSANTSMTGLSRGTIGTRRSAAGMGRGSSGRSTRSRT